MEPRGSVPYSQEFSSNPYSEPNQTNSSYFFKIHSNIFLPSRPSGRSLFCRVYLIKLWKNSYFFSILATWPDSVRSMMQGMKFLIVEPSPLSILSLLIPNIRLRILFLNTLSLSLIVRDHFSKLYNRTDKIIVIYIYIYICIYMCVCVSVCICVCMYVCVLCVCVCVCM